MCVILGSKLVIKSNSELDKILSKACCVPNPVYLQLKTMGKWLGGVSKNLYYKISIGDYNGYPRAILDLLKDRGDISELPTLKYNLIDNPMGGKVISNARNFKLKPFQEDAVSEFICKIKKTSSSSGLLLGACGVGKTIMGSEIIRRFNQKTLILVDKIDLLYQWKDAILKVMDITEKDIYISSDKSPLTENTLVDIMTIQKLYDTRSPLTPSERSKYGTVVVDECHIIPASATSSVVAMFKPKYMVGLTATPYRLDSLTDVIKMFVGPIISKAETKTIVPEVRLTKIPKIIPGYEDVIEYLTIGNTGKSKITLEYIHDVILKDHPERDLLCNKMAGVVAKMSSGNNYSMEPVVRFLKQLFMDNTNWTGRKIKKGPNAGKIIPGVLDVLCKSEIRNNLIYTNILQSYKSNRNIIVLSPRIEHIEYFYNRLVGDGINCLMLTGKTPKKKRQEILNIMREGKCRLLIATFSLIKKGLDIPILDCIHLTHPFKIKSLNEGGDLEQAIGRILRIKQNPKSPEAIVYDYIDSSGAAKYMGIRHVSYYKNRMWKIVWI